jgi:hypothetical protein
MEFSARCREVWGDIHQTRVKLCLYGLQDFPMDPRQTHTYLFA